MADNGSTGLSAVESLLGDRYTREARLGPAFLAFFPIVLLLIAWVTELQNLIPGLLTLFCVFGVVRWISHIARGVGDSREVGLYREWGGKPTTTLLRVISGRLDLETIKDKGQIAHILGEIGHRDIAELIAERKGPKFPTEAKDKAALHECGDELSDKVDALDALYEPVVAWIRENTRENQLLLEENISYGFQRNFFALKTFALVCGFVALAIQAASLTLVWMKNPANITPAAIAVSAGIVLYLLGVIFFVSRESVKVQGFAYARQLINSIYTIHPEKK